MLKVLVLSFEAWRDDTNGGNVLSNIFEGQPFTFAQVYCKPGMPQNALCSRYFHMTGRMAALNILRGKPMGETLTYDAPPAGGGEETAGEQRSGRAYRLFKKVNLPIFYACRELLMCCSKWKSPALRAFVTDFDPDVIFAPLYGSHFMMALDRYVIGLLKKPAISYVSDDHYTLRQLRFSPVYWLDRLLQRRHIRKTVPFYRFLYTMTQEQAEQMRRDTGADMRILRKSAAVPADLTAHLAHAPVRFLYAGGVYLGREKTLLRLVDALEKQKDRATLDIYTNSVPDARILARLNDGTLSRVHPAVPFAELQRIYRDSDVAVHAESFRKKYALLTRLSFSTKIVDCLGSGCAVLAIGPKENAGIRYLEREDAGVCVHGEAEIDAAVAALCANSSAVQAWGEKALSLARRNHDPARTRAQVLQAFGEVAGK